MTVNELYCNLQIQSPMKILSAYNGRVLCYNFNPQKEQHKKLGDRKLLDIWAEIRVTQNAGFGNRADVIICAFVDGQQEYEKALRAAKTCKEKNNPNG